MARQKIPYLVQKASGWHWQPAKALRVAGWPAVALGKERAQAIDQAIKRNDQVAAWRRRADADAPVPTPAVTGSILVADLIDRFAGSRSFTALAPNSRRCYHWCLHQIKDWCGDRPASTLDATLLRDWYHSTHDRHPAKANALLAMMHTLLRFAADCELVTGPNPAARVRRRKVRPAERPLWRPDQVRHVVATADRMVDGLGCGYYSVGTVILTNYWLGQRLNDILALPIRPIQDGRTVIAQHKTNARVSLPSGMVEELVVRLDQQARQSAAVQAGAVVQPMALIISEATRRPYTEAGDTTHHFGRRFRAVRAEASRTMPDCAGLHPQMLRHTAVVALADAGCTVPEIAAISGHSLASVHGILQRYLRATAVQAANAMRKRLAASENAVAVRQEKAQ